MLFTYSFIKPGNTENGPEPDVETKNKYSDSDGTNAYANK